MHKLYSHAGINQEISSSRNNCYIKESGKKIKGLLKIKEKLMPHSLEALQPIVQQSTDGLIKVKITTKSSLSKNAWEKINYSWNKISSFECDSPEPKSIYITTESKPVRRNPSPLVSHSLEGYQFKPIDLKSPANSKLPIFNRRCSSRTPDKFYKIPYPIRDISPLSHSHSRKKLSYM
ncbi:unnamed protein product [Blepharisma stoltei]|uniref:Uncharacterized protein n=1 Tax=Blepharisma stoltei TaxID=1481888 RepID=A0AAU9JDH4_9CILI|nr:unnamed protein product [Blepharisma stoltei]